MSINTLHAFLSIYEHNIPKLSQAAAQCSARCRPCSGKNLATALSRHGIEPGFLIPVESQILSTEPQQLARDIYTYLEIGSLQSRQAATRRAPSRS